MKFLWRLVFIPIAAVVVIFAVANRQSVTLEMWPLPFAIDLPVYLAVLGALVVGVLIGGAVQWISDGRVRRRARAADRKASALARELAATQEAAAREAAPGEPAAAGAIAPQRPKALLPRLNLRPRAR